MLEAVGAKKRENWAYIVGNPRFCANFATFARERLLAFIAGDILYCRLDLLGV